MFLNIEGVTGPRSGEKLRGELLYIDRAHAVELDSDTNFLCDPIGLRGVDDGGRKLGTPWTCCSPRQRRVRIPRRARRGARAGAEVGSEIGRPSKGGEMLLDASG